MEKEQGKLIIIVSVVFAMVLLCMICTSGSAPEVKSLQACTPDVVSVLDDGRELYDFILDQDDDETNSIVFYSAHQEIAVYADGKLIYRLDAVPGIWGNTPGWTWNIVRFSSNVSSLQVQFTPCYPETAGQQKTFYIGSGYNIYRGLMRRAMPAFLISMLVILVGLYISIYWIVICSGSRIDGTLLYLGIFSILLGIWSANETDVATLIVANRQGCSYLAFVTLMLLPIPFILFVKSFLEISDDRICRIICNANLALIVLTHILNATGIYEFRRSLWMTHVLIILTILYLLVVIWSKIVRKQLDQRLKACVGALLLVFLAAIIEVGGYYKSGNVVGLFGRSSFLIFILVLGIESARQTVARLKKDRRMEELEQFALNDSMTGMYNRNAYDYFVKNEKDFEGYVIVTFDLNNLKQCNDQYGHRAGDEYIIKAAHIIEDNFERYGKCYRIGGDEFCCIIPKGRYLKIERVMHKIDQDVEILNHKNIIPVPVGIAYGYAVFTADDTDPEKVRERADEDMYRNKKTMKQS
mgnify:FL=1